MSNTLKKFSMFLNTLKKFRVFGKHSEKIQSVFGERPYISLTLCLELQLRVKKTIEGPVSLCVCERLRERF